MSFIDKLNQITKPKIHEAEYDFGVGDGPETVHFRGLSYTERQELFVKRLTEDGKVDFRNAGLYMNAELVAATLCTKTGKPVATLDAVKAWDPALVDGLADAAVKALELNKKKDDAENPSSAQS